MLIRATRGTWNHWSISFGKLRYSSFDKQHDLGFLDAQSRSSHAVWPGVYRIEMGEENESATMRRHGGVCGGVLLQWKRRSGGRLAGRCSVTSEEVTRDFSVQDQGASQSLRLWEAFRTGWN